MAEGITSVADVPGRIGQNRVLGHLATGGMAEIFLGREPSGRPVVIKRILPHLARQRSFVSMFIDEARIGSMIHHPNVVEIYELGQVGHDLFMTMELLEGENTSSILRRLVGRDEMLSYALAAHIVAEACKGLQAAHDLCDESGNHLRLVHRDVSPQNVFVTYEGEVKVLDFGIATAAHRLTHTATGHLKGKFSYMSPEQCRGEPLDARSDVFALGVVLYELSMQRRLFSRSNELLVLKAVCDDPIPRPSRTRADYPPFLEDICLRALSRDKNQRYPSSSAMHDDLVAAREMLLGKVDARELLATEMQRLFGERIADKRRMLQCVRAGTSPGMLPSTEADEGVVVPQATQATATQQTSTPLSGPIEVPTAEIGPRRWVQALAVATLVVGAAAAVFVVPSLRERAAEAGLDALSEAPPPSPALAPSTPAAPTPKASADLPEPAPAAPRASHITVGIETTPDGAKVLINGDPVGVTPYELRLPVREDVVMLELRRTGYHTLRQRILPDRDQRLVLGLRRKDAPNPPRKSTPQESSGTGFRRFD